MQKYGKNKLRTISEIVRDIENWPTAIGMRVWRNRYALRMLTFRRGLNVVCRRGTQDWNVIHELLFADGYARALRDLARLPSQPLVLDLGANIGLFSLLAAKAHPQAQIYPFEPGPPNYRLLEMNLLANPKLAERIHLARQAVGGEAGEVQWFFDEENPGASNLYAKQGSAFQVSIRPFAEVVDSLPGPIALAKIDIEGAEYELLEKTPPAIWQKIGAISLELHQDPAGRISNDSFLDQLRKLGYQVEEEKVCSYYLYRQS